MRKYLAFALKGCVFVSGLAGVVIMVMESSASTTEGLGSLLYFTQQSNLWISITALTLLVLGLVEHRTGYSVIMPWMYVAKLAFTVSISLTGLTFCLLLAPASRGAFSPWSFGSGLTHVVTPVLSVVEFFVDEYPIYYTNKQTLAVAIPPLYYLAFVMVANTLKVDFGGGGYYPYFFLNFNSPMGWFGLGGEIPYVMGVFYWLAAILALVVGLGFLYARLYQKNVKRARVEG